MLLFAHHWSNSLNLDNVLSVQNADGIFLNSQFSYTWYPPMKNVNLFWKIFFYFLFQNMFYNFNCTPLWYIMSYCEEFDCLHGWWWAEALVTIITANTLVDLVWAKILKHFETLKAFCLVWQKQKIMPKENCVMLC